MEAMRKGVGHAVASGIRRVRLTALVAAALLAAGCATGPAHPPAPREAAGPEYNYLIGPLDTVNIIVWRNPELSMSVPVRPDGRSPRRSSTTSRRRARPPPRWPGTSRRR